MAPSETCPAANGATVPIVKESCVEDTLGADPQMMSQTTLAVASIAKPLLTLATHKSLTTAMMETMTIVRGVKILQEFLI